MDELEKQEGFPEEGYKPRPAWQVWAARVGLAIFIAGLIMYYCNIFGAVK